MLLHVSYLLFKIKLRNVKKNILGIHFISIVTYFRRIQYGNGTQINITVQLQEDNKAILLVALDKFDRPFFACDGGCLDGPVQLG